MRVDVRAFAATIALSIGLLTAVTSCTTADQAAVKAAPRISDATFEASARQVCVGIKHIFDTDTSLPKNAGNKQSADFLDHLDATFADLVRQLRLLPVAGPDQLAVSGWLGDWDAYVAYGHTYAAAVRTGSEGPLIQRDSASQGALRRRIQAFASANNMAPCHFQ
jgi:hypothetical protein